MQFQPYLAEKVKNERKTQTRRPFVPGDVLLTDPLRVMRETRLLAQRLHWQVGKTYAVQPGRGKQGIGHITLTNIRFEDVREISLADAKAEGFETVLDFLAVWVSFYDQNVSLTKLEDGRWRYTQRGESRDLRGPGLTLKVTSRAVEVEETDAVILGFLKSRPAQLYKAWALTFRLTIPTAVQS